MPSAPGVPAGTPVTLQATIDDTRYNNSNGTEPAQAIAAAREMEEASMGVLECLEEMAASAENSEAPASHSARQYFHQTD